VLYPDELRARAVFRFYRFAAVRGAVFEKLGSVSDFFNLTDSAIQETLLPRTESASFQFARRTCFRLVWGEIFIVPV
jgi:hypothetical protein